MHPISCRRPLPVGNGFPSPSQNAWPNIVIKNDAVQQWPTSFAAQRDGNRPPLQKLRQTIAGNSPVTPKMAA